MVRYLFTRIKNKFRLYLCLICGMISMVMIFSLILMFQNGSLNKVIQSGFVREYETQGQYPAILYKYEEHTKIDLDEIKKSGKMTDFIAEKTEETRELFDKRPGLPVVQAVRKVFFLNVKSECFYSGDSYTANVGYIEDVSGEGTDTHYDIVEGADYHGDISGYVSDGVKIPEDAYPCLVDRYTADSMNLVVGEIISFPWLTYTVDPDMENPPILKLYVNGIIEEKHDDHFWSVFPKEEFFIFLQKDDFEDLASDYTREIKSEMWELVDYRYINSSNIDKVKADLDFLTDHGKDTKVSENISAVLTRAEKESVSVRQMLYVIVLPLIVLVLTFIGMIAFRIVDSESGELRTLKDRGLGKGRLIGTHILLSVILAAISYPFGLVLSYFFGRLVAGVDDFCGFSLGGNGISVRDYSFTPSMALSGAIAALISVIVNVIPVLIFFKKKRNNRRVATVPVWEKYFFDVALLGISVYLLFNFNRQLPVLAQGVMNGEGIDPVIFINATLFLFACGLLMLRIIFYIIRIIFRIGRNRFPAIIYAGILQIMRTRKASGVISVFLVVTVAMSIFNANMARTVNSNKQARIEYNVGTDIRIKEHWDPFLRGPDRAHLKWKFVEPDFGVYRDLKDSGAFESVTKVAIDDSAAVRFLETRVENVNLMAINTKEFGETAFLRDGLNDEHWYNYLNELAASSNGVIISSNMSKALEVDVGGTIFAYRYPPKALGKQAAYAQSVLKVVAICDSFPGYDKYGYSIGDDGKVVEEEKYLIVMNYAEAVGDFGVMPYEVWAKGDTGASEAEEMINKGFEGTKRYLDDVVSWEDELSKEKSTAILQITNGVFTADFMVALLLCVIGYMIYWITSIRDRELLFGICRAMGITKGEIDRMLIIEQVFLSVMSIVAGVFAGSITSMLFAKVFSTVYLPEKHNVDVFIASFEGDMIRLCGVLLFVVIFCMLWIRRIVGKLNISQALKLGED